MNLLDELRTIVGATHVLTDAPSVAPFLIDWRRRFTGTAQAVVVPASTDEVAAVVTRCAQARAPIVPQGGNTGLVGGATPDASGRAIVLSLTRLDRVRDVDAVNGTMVAEAGCRLQHVQEVAREAGRLFPLSLAAEGSATIGGDLSASAGGAQVLRFGNARDLTLGLEVVLPSGAIWNGLRALRKDNTGYDLRDIFIGAEGTLGVITAACLKIYPLPAGRATGLIAVPSIDAALQLLQVAQVAAGPALTAFEFFSDFCLQLVERHFAGRRSPFSERHAYYVLAEISDHESEEHGAAVLQAIAEAALAMPCANDAVVAQSGAQSRALWALRELISEAQAAEGRNIKHDIALPISALGRFTAETDALLGQQFGAVRMVTFGHLGDGNLHYNVSPPPGLADDEFLARQPDIYRCVHDQVARYAGSISAEHGIGQLKRDENRRYKSEVEMALMQTLKSAFDPLGIMNPGKVV